MIRVTTDSGLTMDFAEDKLDDWDTVKLLAEVDQGEDYKIVYAAERIFGDDIELIKEHVRTNDGIVRFSSMITEIRDIFGKVGELKNS